jgi:hypothetical protein
MSTYTVGLAASAYGLYEIHKQGCRHLNMTKKYPYGFADIEGETATDAATRFETRNEGCFTKLAPCAKKG